MFVNPSIRFIISLALVSSSFFPCEGAAYLQNSQKNNTSKRNDTEAIVRSIRNQQNDVHHQLQNHENQLKTLEAQIAIQNDLLEEHQQQQNALLQNFKSENQTQLDEITTKIDAFELISQTITSDLRNLCTTCSEQQQQLQQIKTIIQQKVNELEKKIAIQEDQLQHLTSTVTTLMELVRLQQGGSKKSKEKVNVQEQQTAQSFVNYVVKSGDTLETIARVHSSTVSDIKSLNNLSTDRIFSGQSLKIPNQQKK